MFELEFEVPWSFFDEAYQGHPLVCGVGVVVHLKQNHYLHIIYAPSIGTNNRAEFIALWTLLETAIKKDVKKLHEWETLS